MAQGRFRVVAAVCMAIGCGYPKKGPVPGPVSPALVQQAQTRWPDATEQSLTQGRELFVTRCQKCHDLPEHPAHAGRAAVIATAMSLQPT